MESLSRLSIKITGNIMCCADISRRNKTDKKRILLNGISVGHSWYSPHTEDLQGMDELPGENPPQENVVVISVLSTKHGFLCRQVFNYRMFLLLKRPENLRNGGLRNKQVTVLKTPLHRRCWNFCCQLH